MKDKEQIRILAIRTLTGCESYIRKVLKEETTYFFYNDYEDDPLNKGLIRKKEKGHYSTIPIDFFSTNQNDKSPLISISAIVGKNGDGKSSVIELLMRILNNFSYASGYLEKHDYLFYVEGVYAKVFYSIGEKVYVIENIGDEVKLSSTHLDKSYNFNIKKPLKESTLLNEIEPILFYTQISNYSLYAYNTKDFHKENTLTKENWINGIFHKNDGYQTPIVLNPWRDNGVININTENGLVKQRLTSLFVADESFRRINNKQYADSLILTISESKLENKTLYDFFKRTLYSNLSLHIEEKLEVKKIRNNLAHNSSHYIDKFKDSIEYNRIINSLKIIDRFVKEEFNLFERAVAAKNRLITDIRKERSEPNWLPDETDIKIIFNTLSEINNMSAENHLQEYLDKETINLVQELNSIQFMRCIVISAFNKEWQLRYRDFQIDSKVKENVYDYLVYKSISTVDKYNKYNEFRKDTYFAEFISNKNYYFEIQENIKDAVDRICNDPSHVSLKVRQTINFIKLNNSYRYIDFDNDFRKNVNEEVRIKVTEDSNDEEVALLGLNEYKKRIDVITSTEDNIDTLELLPPPIFKVDISIKQEDVKDISLLSELSSGERQELNSISSVVYHLQNISSIEKNDNMIKYKYINLIFEEIELYFHPEYQRKYIKRLIDQIQKSKLKWVSSINICFITHSPFILSDIPSNNILKIEDGKPVYELDNGILKEQTFAENIHELLANKFFLDESFMGEFAKEKIESLIKYLLNEEDNKWNPQTAKETIEIIAESILKERLQLLYDKKTQWEDKEYIKERIKYLQSKLD